MALRTLALHLSLVLLAACASTESKSGSSSASGAGGGTPACKPCVAQSDCPSGDVCAQLAGDTYCAPTCGAGSTCAPDRACTTLSTFDGKQADVCVPRTNVCGGSTTATTGGGGAGSTTTSTGSGGEICGSLHGPDVSGCCSSCQAGSANCQANGCYGGWWCNVDTCKCQSPPGPCGATTGAGGGGSTGAGGAGAGGGGTVGPAGGKLDVLRFAIVGDTRPPSVDDTAGYPKAIITKIWQDVQAESPRPPFAITTGDYVFAKPYGSQAAAQLDLYLAARAVYGGEAFPSLGNHECTGATASNCGQGNADGVTVNYSTFLSKMLAPLGVSKPYYAIHVDANDGSWTSKFVFVAANAWDSAQATWLANELAKPTTYTFVVRHEPSTATTAPGVSPSEAIIAKHPYTLKLCGHTHTFEYFSGEKQVIVGNGGAPLTGSVDYGYVVAAQRADGAIVFREHDYATNAVTKTFAVKADGSVAP